jgi:hypothetical protein
MGCIVIFIIVYNLFGAGFFLTLAHPVCKMRIIQEPKNLALYYFEEKKTESLQHV